MIPERTIPRWFSKQKGIRQNAEVSGTGDIRSVRECSVVCISNAQECVGFNFKQGPPAICELCRVPHDAPNADMMNNITWDHYVIMP